MHLQYQTNDLIEAPFAQAIELFCDIVPAGLKVSFELTYLKRDTIDIEEIIEEGYKGKDNIKWSGVLPQVWSELLQRVQDTLTLTDRTEIEEYENYWYLNIDGREGYPEQEELAMRFLQEIQQAAIEMAGLEAPLYIAVLRIDKKITNQTTFTASFVTRTFFRESPNGTEQWPWEKLGPFLNEICGGDFRPDEALTDEPEKSGLYINLGDPAWFELGKSYLNQPSKILQFLD